MKFSLQLAAALALATALLTSGCGPKKVRYADDPSIHAALDVTVEWIKNKNDAVDLSVILRNKSDHAITVSGDAMHMDFNGAQGVNTVNFGQTIQPGGSHRALVLFHFGKAKATRKGIATFSIDPIWKGSNNDEKRSKLPAYKRQFELM